MPNRAYTDKLKEDPVKYAEFQRKNRQYVLANKEKIRERQRKYSEVNKERIAEHKRNYNKENREKVSKQRHEYDERNKSSKLAYMRQYHEKNKERIRRRELEYYHANKEQIAIKRRQYDEEPANKERKTKYMQERHRNNPDIAIAYTRQRRAAKAKAVGSHTESEWRALKSYYMDQCLACGEVPEKLTRDHVVPLSMGGSDDIGNIQPLCKSCNSTKMTKAIDYRT